MTKPKPKLYLAKPKNTSDEELRSLAKKLLAKLKGGNENKAPNPPDGEPDKPAEGTAIFLGPREPGGIDNDKSGDESRRELKK